MSFVLHSSTGRQPVLPARPKVALEQPRVAVEMKTQRVWPGKRKSKYTVADLARVAELITEGMSRAAIAEEIGTSEDTANRLVRRAVGLGLLDPPERKKAGRPRGADTLPRVRPGPCHGCELSDRCKTDLLACRTFARWAAIGGKRLRTDDDRPTRAIYARVFAGAEDDDTREQEVAA